MNVRESMRTHPWRWTAAILLVLIAVAAGSLALAVRALLQPQRFTALLQSQLADAGLVLSVDQPAAPAIWPHPAVQLEGFRLSRTGTAAPLLTAREARIVVRWRTLLRRELAIERLEIQSPRIDLDQLQALLAALPKSQGAPQLPHIGAGLKLSDGTLLRNGQPLLMDLDAETGELLQGQPFHLTVSARNGAEGTGSVVLDALPLPAGDGMRFDRLQMDARIDRGPHLRLAGNAFWRGGEDVSAVLQGALNLPAAAPSAGSSAAHAGAAAIPTPVARDYTLALRIEPARKDVPLNVAFTLDGAGEHVDARLPPLALVAWWNDVREWKPGTPLVLPQLEGSAQADEVGYGALHLRGVRIDAGPKVAPLADGGTKAPAASGPEANHGASH